ncbi:hypothetical protein [Haloferax sp. DFSO60]|uniref:hypothetical protein n=1 Tax=Haloferax sp. DFSO60 TaxID=3388652 RepID=UPI00397AABA5
MGFELNLEAKAEATDDLPNADDVLADHGEITIGDLFSSEFVTEYTDFETFDEMVEASPSDASSAEGLSLIPDGTWDDFVAENTVFADEEAMVLAARDYWVAEQLGL